MQGLQKYLVIAKKNMIRNIKGLFSLVAPDSVVVTGVSVVEVVEVVGSFVGVVVEGAVVGFVVEI